MSGQLWSGALHWQPSLGGDPIPSSAGASSSVHAINQTLHTLVPEALSLMDLPATATDDEALASFVEKASLTMDEAVAVRAEPSDTPLLPSVLLDVRARRAADAR